jgi:imidazolonepropionase-like amidohydrolase
VLPGLGDAHQHITFDLPPMPRNGSVWESVRLKQSTAERTLRGIRNAQICLNAGILILRDVGNAADYADTEVRKAIDRGWFDGPTILNSGKIIGPFGGQDWYTSPEHEGWWRDEYLDADGPEAIREAVRKNIFYGAKLIKIVADEFPYCYSEQEMRAAVEEAHAAGMTVAVHVNRDACARNVIAAGADTIEHGYNLTDSVFQLMKEKGTWLVGTEMPLKYLLIQLGDLPLDPQTIYNNEVAHLKSAHAIGVKMAFGTDATMEIPERNRAQVIIDQIDVWQEAGLPSPFILKAMTTNVAEVMHLQNERESISPGYFADIIATQESPLENIQAVRNVVFVMKNGKVIRAPAKAQ